MTLLRILGMLLLVSMVRALPAEPVKASGGIPAGVREMVVLLHGLGRGSTAMWLLAKRLESAGFRVERVGYRSLRQSPEEIIALVRGEEVTLKRILQEPGRTMLYPENSPMAALELHPEEVQIQGVPVGQMRFYR